MSLSAVLYGVCQVLTLFTCDARDVVEVRHSEAKLKSRVADLQHQLQVWYRRAQSEGTEHGGLIADLAK